METFAQPDPSRPPSNAGDLLDRAPAGLLELSDDGLVTYANPALAEMLEATEPLEGRTIDTLLTKGTQVFYQTHFFPLLKLSGRADEIYMAFKSASGEAVHVLVNAMRRETAAGARSLCVCIRIRERQKYEAELLRAKKDAEAASAAKTRFLSVMSHDLRTPLGAIAGYVDLLAMGLRGDVNDAQRTDLDRIKALSQSLLAMVEDILHFARSEPGTVPVNLEPVRVERVLADVETTMLPHVKKAGLEYRRDVSDPSLTVRADNARLHRILMNLLGNAIKFTPKGGQVSIGAKSMGRLVSLQVSDTGRGIPPDRIDDIFRPFVQVESTDEKLGGVGLGLAISREFARAMGGDIGAESTPGKGSVFTVTLSSGSP